MSNLSRRDFLKLSGVVPASLLLSNLTQKLGLQQQYTASPEMPNVIIILMDAMNAKNLSVYGYPRQTTPNLGRFAERATVFHRHHAGGNFTIPGVASLLTGTYPWAHRAFNQGGLVTERSVEKNLFRAIKPEYHLSAFPQNAWAYLIVSQFSQDIDALLSPNAFDEFDYILGRHFKNDKNMAYRALDDFLFKMSYPPPSILFGAIQRALFYRDSNRLVPNDYPRGLPRDVNYPSIFRLEDLFGGITSYIQSLGSPFLTYLHLFPPHAPYRPTYEFNRHFDASDGLPIKKPIHRFSDQSPYSKLKAACLQYDRYLASIDNELGKCLDTIEKSGLLDNSYVIITSDHGEMFERGETAHVTPMLYDSIVRVPLIIYAPGQTSRKDIHSFTNAVDLLPTLAHITGSPTPDWSEGMLLPTLGGEENMIRSTFSVEAQNNSAFGPLKKATIAMYQGSYKMIYYTGYEPEDSFELYNLDDDIEELKDLYAQEIALAKKMKDELLDHLDKVNQPFNN